MPRRRYAKPRVPYDPISDAVVRRHRARVQAWIEWRHAMVEKGLLQVPMEERWRYLTFERFNLANPES